MRVLIIHGVGFSNTPSGEISVIEEESKNLIQHNHTVNKLLLPTGSSNSQSMKHADIIISLIWSNRVYRDIRRSISSFKPDIIHFHSVLPFLSISAYFAAKGSKIPTVQTLHNGRFVCVEGAFFWKNTYCQTCISKSSWYGVIRSCGRGRSINVLLTLINKYVLHPNRLYQWVDKFIAVSDFVKDKHVEAGFPEGSIVVKNNYFGEVQAIKNASRLDPKDRKGLIYVGRVSKAKGSDILKKLIPKVSGPIHIVGTGPGLSGLKEVSSKLGLSNVKFWGHIARTEVIELLSSCRYSIIPSQCGESFGMSAVESMALGIPIIAADVGGLGPLVKESKSGIVVTPGAHELYIKAIDDLNSNPNKCAQFMNNGRAYVKAKLNGDVGYTNTMKIYDSLLIGNE
jgi:glycosyltransferase involved in cell wall biosynthesis